MAEQTPRRERQDALKNRARILETAQALFDRFGVENVSMNGIAQEAQVGAGTLYRHFGSKSDLCFALVQGQLSELADELSLRLQSAEGDQYALFEEMTLRYLEFKEEKLPLLKGMESVRLATGGPTQSPAYELLRQPFVDLFIRVSASESDRMNGNGTGEGVDAVFRADMYLAALGGDSFRLQRFTRQLPLETIAENVCAIFYPRS